MKFKKGMGWRVCFDEETGLYTAEVGAGANHELFEITKEIYDRVDDPDVTFPQSLISKASVYDRKRQVRSALYGRF